MCLVSTGPVGRHRSERDKENIPVENTNSYRAPMREKNFEDFDKKEVYSRKGEQGQIFDKKQPYMKPEARDQDMVKGRWREQPAYDSEVMRSKVSGEEFSFKNAETEDNFKSGPYFDEPQTRPMKSNGRGQRPTPGDNFVNTNQRQEGFH